MGVTACNHSKPQVELARHREFIKRFNSVQYLHVTRCFNKFSVLASSASVEETPTEALGAKTKNLVLGEERYEELRKINRIQKNDWVQQTGGV